MPDSTTAAGATAEQRRQSLIATARDLVPTLRERAPEADRLRRIPDATIRDLLDAGIFRMLKPARYGGYQLDYGPIQLDVAAELGRGCGSTAWVASVLACHDWILGMFPPEAQDDVWSRTPDVLMVSGIVPEAAEVEALDGGFRLSGRWKFASGVHACDWAVLGGPVKNDSGPPDMHFFLVPKSDYQIEDTWFAAGLRGTGSNDIVITDAEVPEHRSVAFRLLGGGTAPGAVLNDCHIYNLPLFAVFPFNICAPGIGAARGMLEAYIERATNQKVRFGGARVAEFPTVQLRVSEAAAEIDCAEMLYRRAAVEVNDVARRGETFTLEQRARFRRDLSYAAMLCMRAVDRIGAILGAHGLQDDTVEQRAFRDVHAVNAQIGLQWDVNGPLYGKVALGAPLGDARL